MTSDQPLISVLMPAYNHERYVASTVRSILEQDWPRIELIVLDDGSSDGTWRILQELKAECEGKLERVVMMTQRNRGVAATLNRLSGLAHGDFFALIASDDQYLPGAFRHLIAPMLRDAEIGLVVGQNELMDGESRTCYWDRDREIVYDPTVAVYRTFNEHLASKGVVENGPGFGDYSEFVRDNHVANGYLIRGTCFRRILPYSDENLLEDLWLHLQLSKICRYRAVPEHTFRYRWHAQNLVKQSDRMRAMAYRTRKWEADNVSRPENARWRDAFMRGVNRKRVEFRLGRLLELAWVSDLDTRRRILKVFGLSLTLQRRAMKPM